MTSIQTLFEAQALVEKYNHLRLKVVGVEAVIKLLDTLGDEPIPASAIVKTLRYALAPSPL